MWLLTEIKVQYDIHGIQNIIQGIQDIDCIKIITYEYNP